MEYLQKWWRTLKNCYQNINTQNSEFQQINLSQEGRRHNRMDVKINIQSHKSQQETTEENEESIKQKNKQKGF